MDIFEWLCLHFPRVLWWEHAPLLSVVIGFVINPFSAALPCGIASFLPSWYFLGSPHPSPQINYLLSNAYLRSASEKTPTHSKTTLFKFYRTTSHFFTFVASAEKALGKTEVFGSPHTHPAGPDPQSQFSCSWRSIPLFLKTSGLGPVLWTQTRDHHWVGPHGKEMNNLPACQPLPCEIGPTPVSLLTAGFSGEHLSLASLSSSGVWT